MVIINLQSNLVEVRLGVVDLNLKHPSLSTPYSIKMTETGEIQLNNYHKIIKEKLLPLIYDIKSKNDVSLHIIHKPTDSSYHKFACIILEIIPIETQKNNRNGVMSLFNFKKEKISYLSNSIFDQLLSKHGDLLFEFKDPNLLKSVLAQDQNKIYIDIKNYNMNSLFHNFGFELWIHEFSVLYQILNHFYKFKYDSWNYTLPSYDLNHEHALLGIDAIGEPIKVVKPQLMYINASSISVSKLIETELFDNVIYISAEKTDFMSKFSVFDAKAVELDLLRISFIDRAIPYHLLRLVKYVIPGKNEDYNLSRALDQLFNHNDYHLYSDGLKIQDLFKEDSKLWELISSQFLKSTLEKYNNLFSLDFLNHDSSELNDFFDSGKKFLDISTFPNDHTRLLYVLFIIALKEAGYIRDQIIVDPSIEIHNLYTFGSILEELKEGNYVFISNIFPKTKYQSLFDIQLVDFKRIDLSKKTLYQYDLTKLLYFKNDHILVLHKFRQPTLLQDFIPKIRSDTEIISIVHQVNPINELLIQTSEVDISTESNILTQSYDENFDESEENTLDEKLYKNVLIVYPSMSFLAAISTLDNFSIREIEAKVLIDEKIDDVTSYLLENQLLHQVGNHYRIDYDIFRKFNTVKDKFMQTKFKENVTDLTDCSILLSQIRIDLSDFDSTASEKENTLYLLLHVLNVLDRLAPFNNDVKYINNGLGLYFSFIKYFDNPIIFESILHQFNIFRGHIEATITSIQNEQLREAIFISESELETKIQNSSLPEIIIQENQYNQLEVVDSDIGEEGDEIDVEVNIEVNDKLDKDLQRQNHGGKSRIVMPFESIEEDTQDTGIIQDLQRNQSNVKSLINNIINDNSNENEVINKLQGEFTIDEEKIEHNNPITSKKGVKESIKPVLSSLEINEEFSEIIVPWDIIDSKYDYVHILGDTISFQYNEIFTFTYLIILKNESLIVNNEFNYLIRYLPINKLSYERYLVLYELYNYSNMLIELKEKIELSKSRPKRTKMASIKFIRNSKAMSKNLDDFLRNYNLEISENTLFKSIYIVNDMVKTSEYNEEQNYLLMFMEMILDLYREKSWPLCLLPKLREIDLDKNKFLSMDTFECLRTIDITEDEFKLIKVYVQIIDNEIKDFSGEDDIQSIEIPNQTIENNVSYNPDYVDELMKEIERERNLKDKKAKEVLNKITHSPKDNKRQPVIREIQLNWLKGITKKEVTMFTKLGIITVSDFLNNIQKIEGFSKERVDELYVLCTLAVQNPNQEINHVHLPNYYYSDLLSEKVNDRLLQQAIQKIIELHHTGPLILLGKIILEVIIPSLTGNHVMQSVQEAIELINKASINTPTQIYNLTEGITDIESKFQSTPLFRNYIMDSYAHKLYQILQDIQFSKEFIANLVELINPIN